MEIDHEPSGPFPPRFRWLLRGIAIGLAVLVISVGLRVWWGREASRRLDALVAQAHARGEPILLADFDTPPVPDSRNAALSLLKAAEAASEVDGFNTFADAQLTWQNLSAADIANVRRILAALQPAMDHVARARVQGAVNWNPAVPVIPQSPPVMPEMTEFNQQRNLANALGFAAMGSHAIGDDRASVERVRDSLLQVGVVARGRPSIVRSLVCTGLSMFADQTVDQLIFEWHVQPHELNAPGSATTDQLRALIRELLDDRAMKDLNERSWLAERASSLDIGRMRWAPEAPWQSWAVVRPMLELDGQRAARRLEAISRAARQPNLPSALGRLPAPPSAPDASILEKQALILSQMLTGAPPGLELTTWFEAIADRRIAAVIVAVRLYQLDHDGRNPDTLAELVPAYLPAVPIDPMAPDGRALGYHPHSNPPVVYSVGRNGIDDGGTTLPTGSASPWRMPDAVFPLGPASPAATAPSAP